MQDTQSVASAGGRFQHVSPAVLIALVIVVGIGFPVFILRTSHVIPFTNDFHCDPWAPFGLVYLVDQAKIVLSGRITSRLPEVFPGYLTVRMLPVALVDYVNFGILCAASGLAVFFSLRRLAGAWPALLAAAIFEFNCIVMGNFSTTFAGSSMCFNAIAAAAACAAQLASGTRRNLLLVGCGFALGLAIHSHFYSALCGGVIPLYAYRWSKGLSFAEIFKIGVANGIGFIGATAALGALNWLLWNGDFLFFMTQFKAIGTVNFRDYYIEGWYLKGARGATLALAFVLSFGQLALIARRSVPSDVRNLTLIFNIPLAIVSLAVLGDMLTGGLYIQYDYYYVAMFLPISLSIGALLGSVRWHGMFLVSLAAVSVIALAVVDLLSLETIQRIIGISPDDGLLALSMVGLILVCMIALQLTAQHKAIALVALLLSLVLLEISIKPLRFGRQAWEDGVRSNVSYGLPNYVRIRTALQFLTDFKFPTRPVFWVSVENGGTWETIALPRSYSYCLVEMHLPQLDTEAPDFQAGRYMVLAARESNLVEEANAVLAKRQLHFDEIRRKTIDDRGLSYQVVIGKLAAVAAGN